MKTEPNDPIYPISQRTLIGCAGLTKREHFAGLAMQGYISADYTANSGMPFESMALWSVQMADALIAELNRTQD